MNPDAPVAPGQDALGEQVSKPKRKLIRWRGPAVSVVYDATYRRLFPDKHLAWPKRIYQSDRLRQTVLYASPPLPGLDRCRIALMEPVRCVTKRRCRQFWCPHCYAKRLLTLVRGIKRLREHYQRNCVVSVERWVIKPELFEQHLEEIWQEVRPARPPWLPAKQARATSWTVIAATPTSVVIQRRTVGTGVFGASKMRRRGKNFQWGRFESHRIVRIVSIKQLAELMHYPVSWLSSERFRQLSHTLLHYPDGTRRRFISNFRTMDNLVVKSGAKKSKRPKLTAAQKARVVRAYLLRSIRKELFTFHELPPALQSLARSELVVDNETRSMESK